jgi:hypothetical protein
MRPVASVPLYRNRWSYSLSQKERVDPINSRKSGKADGRWIMVVFRLQGNGVYCPFKGLHFENLMHLNPSHVFLAFSRPNTTIIAFQIKAKSCPHKGPWKSGKGLGSQRLPFLSYSPIRLKSPKQKGRKKTKTKPSLSRWKPHRLNGFPLLTNRFQLYYEKLAAFIFQPFANPPLR